MSLDTIVVSSIMSSRVITQREDQNIMAACKVMNDNNVGSVVIVEAANKGEQPIGIITERDILRTLGKLTVDLQKPSSTYMSKPVVTIQSSASIKDAMQTMNSKGIRRLVVVDKNNNMVGVVTQKDIFKAINKNRSLITSFTGQNYPTEHREVYERFTDHMFDLLPKV